MDLLSAPEPFKWWTEVSPETHTHTTQAQNVCVQYGGGKNKVTTANGNFSTTTNKKNNKALDWIM